MDAILSCAVGSSPILIIDVFAAVQELDHDPWKENRASHFEFCFRFAQVISFSAPWLIMVAVHQFWDSGRTSKCGGNDEVDSLHFPQVYWQLCAATFLASFLHLDRYHCFQDRATFEVAD